MNIHVDERGSQKFSGAEALVKERAVAYLGYSYLPVLPRPLSSVSAYRRSMVGSVAQFSIICEEVPRSRARRRKVLHKVRR